MFLSTYTTSLFVKQKLLQVKEALIICSKLSSMCRAKRHKYPNTRGELETTFVEIKQKNVIFGSIYSYPNSNIDDFIIYMIKIHDKL